MYNKSLPVPSSTPVLSVDRGCPAEIAGKNKHVQCYVYKNCRSIEIYDIPPVFFTPSYDRRPPPFRYKKAEKVENKKESKMSM
jgi:hypothetical protein